MAGDGTEDRKEGVLLVTKREEDLIHVLCVATAMTVTAQCIDIGLPQISDTTVEG